MEDPILASVLGAESREIQMSKHAIFGILELLYRVGRCITWNGLDFLNDIEEDGRFTFVL
jgi:hypothetical protein